MLSVVFSGILPSLALYFHYRAGQHVDLLSRIAQFQGMGVLRTLPFTPTVSCEPAASRLMDLFDWKMMPVSAYTLEDGCGVVDGQPWIDERRVQDPQTVWAAPHAVQRLLEAAEQHFDPGRADRMVLFSGTEFPLSVAFGQGEAERRSTVARLRRYFRRIVYQTKDVALEGVHLAPMGMSWGYFMALPMHWLSTSARPEDYGQRVADFGRLLNGSLSTKTRNILAAWGAVASWLDDPIHSVVPVVYLDAAKLLLPRSNSSLRAVEVAHLSRRALRAWAETPAARAAGVERRDIGPPEWWQVLSSYRFILSPAGSGIQTAKNIEALLVLTVPIVQRSEFPTYGELVSLGFPLVLVDSWPEVTRNNTNAWWAAFSPRLESFRRNCLTVEGYWRIYIGEVSRCE